MAIDKLPSEIKTIFTNISEQKDNKTISSDWHRVVRVLKKGSDNKGNYENVAKRVTGETKNWANNSANSEVKNNTDARKLAFLAKHINWIPSNKFLRNIVTDLFLGFCGLKDFFTGKKSTPIQVQQQPQQPQVQKREKQQTSGEDSTPSGNGDVSSQQQQPQETTEQDQPQPQPQQPPVVQQQEQKPTIQHKPSAPAAAPAAASAAKAAQEVVDPAIKKQQIARLEDLRKEVEKMEQAQSSAEDVSSFIWGAMIDNDKEHNNMQRSLVAFTHGGDLLKKLRFNDLRMLVLYETMSNGKSQESNFLANPEVFQAVASAILSHKDDLSEYMPNSYEIVTLLQTKDSSGRLFIENPEIFKVAVPLIQLLSPEERLSLLSNDKDGQPALITLPGFYPLVAAIMKEDIGSLMPIIALNI